MQKFVRLVLFALAISILVSGVARAQGSITGQVKDSSGALLPGVTVEAASPVLIEKARSVVTDGTGQYDIVSLRPGTYTVTFTLQGFNTVKREGIELSGSFAATVNVELKVGSVAETVTVTGESPIVDIKSVGQQRVIGKEVMDALPSGRTPYGVAVLTPGIITNQIDVGGTNTLGINTMAIHGGRTVDSRVMLDGVSMANVSGAGQNSNFVPDTGGTQEVTVDYAAGSAEMENGGVRINLIPREGGNTFKGSFFGTGANSTFQGNNYTQALKDQGLLSPNSLKLAYDINPSGGGPIMRDKLWFYSSARFQTNQNYVAGTYYNLNAGDPTQWTYAPDLNRQGVYLLTQKSINTRLTLQANAKNKFGIYFENQTRDWDNLTSAFSPESMTRYQFPKERVGVISWSSPLTSRLLVDVRLGDRGEVYRDFLPPEGDVYRKLIAVQEQSGFNPGIFYRGGGVGSGVNQPYYYIFMPNILNFSSSVSYVTGAHAFKVGFTNRWGTRDNIVYDNDYGMVFRFNNGVPNQLTERATPFERIENLHFDGGAFAQDKWTLNRLTLNLGVRYDHLNFGFPEEHEGPGPLVPTRNLTFAEIPSWVVFQDLSPRLGAAFDLFGNGKTAVKVNLSKYIIAQGASLNPYSDLGNPVLRLSTLVTRSWTDANHDFNPNCDLLSPLANGECGAMSDARFGQAVPTTTLDPAVLSGWGVSPYNWEFSTSVQHELAPRIGLNVGYFRRWYGNFTVTDNRLTAPSDYSQFSIAAPVDSRLPGGGGYAINGLYDLNPNKVGQVDNFFTFASNFGNQIEHWNGIDVSLNARLQKGVLLQGGFSTGRTSTDNCDVVTKVDNPSPLYCHVDTNFLTQVKLLGTYTVPKVDVQVAATFQSFAGPNILGTYNAPNALVQSSLGRALSGGAANIPVNLVSPGTIYNQQANQLDVRFAKIFKINTFRAAVNLDLYNALNGNAILAQQNTYTAAAWQTPTRILNARLFKLSLQLDF